MRIVIDVQSEKVTAIGADTSAPAEGGDALPSAPSAALLARARKLGAMNAGPAQFGTGAALAAATPSSETPRVSAPPRRPRAAKKRARRTR